MAQEHFDRLTAIDASFLHQEGPASHMHVGARHDLRGPAAALRGVPRLAAHAPAPRAALPPEAVGPAAGERPAAVGRRPHVRHRVPRAPQRAAQPRVRGAAAAARRPDLLPAARPLAAAVGAVDDRGARGQSLRADLQEPPRDDRRDLRRRPRAGDVRRLAGAGGRSPTPTRPGRPRPSRAPSSCSPPARWAPLRTGVSTAVRAATTVTRPAQTLRRARGRRPRASARSSGPGSTPRPTRR